MDGQRWELLDRAGTVAGRFSRSFEPPPGTRCRSAEVRAVVEWNREASEPQYHQMRFLGGGRAGARVRAGRPEIPGQQIHPLVGRR